MKIVTYCGLRLCMHAFLCAGPYVRMCTYARIWECMWWPKDSLCSCFLGTLGGFLFVCLFETGGPSFPSSHCTQITWQKQFKGGKVCFFQNPWFQYITGRRPSVAFTWSHLPWRMGETVNACMHAWYPVWFLHSHPGNDIVHSGLGLHTSINVIKTIPNRHAWEVILI